MEEFKKYDTFQASGLSVGYRHQGQTVHCLSQLNFQIDPGEFICLLGPNGGGKSTLLRTLGGLQEALEGDVMMGTTSMPDMSAAERSRQLAVVLTDPVDTIDLKARDIVALGRIPYLNWSGILSEEDQKVIDRVMRQVNVLPLADRLVTELSDGEKQRVLIARALAQEPRFLVLDEPTAHLDLTWRVEVMLLLKQLSHDWNLGVIMSTHDFELAMRLADRIWMIGSDATWNDSIPEELALNRVFENLFNNDNLSFSMDTGSWTIRDRSQQTMSLEGEGSLALWTERLVRRQGFTPVGDQSTPGIRIQGDESKPCWVLHTEEGQTEYFDLKSLSTALSVMMKGQP